MGLFKNTVTISFFTLLSRIFGFIRDVFFAKYLGAGYMSEIFLVAFRVPNFFRNLFAEGVFYSSFVPILSGELSKKDNESAIKTFSQNVFSLMFYFIFVLTIMAEISMPYIIKVLAPVFSEERQKYALTIQLARIMFPYLLIVSLSSILSAILNCYEKFYITSPTPIILNLSFILFSIIGSLLNADIAKFLSVAVLVGGSLEFVWLFYFTCRQKMILYPKTIKTDVLTNQFLKLFSNGFILVSITQLNGLVDSVFATFFTGAVSYLYYADRMTQLPLTLIGAAISKGALPILSQKINVEKEETFAIQENILFYALFLGIPCAIGLFNIADTAIPLLFQSGKFTADNSLEVIKCIKILSLAIPAYIATKVFQTMFFANKDTKIPAAAGIVSLIFNVVFNAVFTRYRGYYGILFSTLLSTYANLFFLLFYLLKKKYAKFSITLLTRLLKLIYPVLFMILTLSLCDKISIDATKKIYLFVELSVTVGFGGIAYMFVGWMLGMVDIRRLRF
jgi:putative peptidoglycan lipid II flippase